MFTYLLTHRSDVFNWTTKAIDSNNKRFQRRRGDGRRKAAAVRHCVRVQRRLLGDVVSWVRGAAKCPYGPSQNASYVMTRDGNYYSATVADFAGRDAAVYRSMGPSRPLRTVQYNSRWLNGALSTDTDTDSDSPFNKINATTLIHIIITIGCQIVSIFQFRHPLSRGGRE